ncbi:dehydrogenase [Kribbella antibiotica]|uniref:Dehydrogenase n=1 Tax=Kribbella antibiotica TaxID=190195 RepID=A0A4R4YUB8_9ACTN|nr:alcohol dehydrogenase catalytic domain-containing protein [Kribbella antibiotica]TDD48044.1 dehydrogenase [Kribbella antibiotica]
MSLHRALTRLPGGRVEVAELPTPALETGDVMLAPVTAGICGTDWQVLRGLRDDPSTVLGHEGVARVVASSNNDLTVGSLVTVNPTHPTDPSFLLGHNVHGLWAERTRIPATAVRAGLVLPVPEGAERPGVAALAEPLASALYGVEIALTVTKPAALVVWGDGIVGRLARDVWQRELADLQVLLVGHGPDATDPGDPALPELLAGLPGPVGVVIATPRTGTQDALTAVDRHVQGPLVVDVHGGLSAGPIPLSAGAVDVAAVRALNCGGEPQQPLVRRIDRASGPLHLYGHRGVSGAHLTRAVNLLLAGESDLGVLTHEVDLEGAADLINAVLGSERRMVGGRRVLKTAVRISA